MPLWSVDQDLQVPLLVRSAISLKFTRQHYSTCINQLLTYELEIVASEIDCQNRIVSARNRNSAVHGRKLTDKNRKLFETDKSLKSKDNYFVTLS